MSRCVRCFVSGRVQGVWFRGGTQKQALALGLAGYARNLPDGRVEVLACGAPEAVEKLQAWLWVGPPSARVEAVTCAAAEEPCPTGFATR